MLKTFIKERLSFQIVSKIVLNIAKMLLNKLNLLMPLMSNAKDTLPSLSRVRILIKKIALL